MGTDEEELDYEFHMSNHWVEGEPIRTDTGSWMGQEVEYECIWCQEEYVKGLREAP